MGSTTPPRPMFSLPGNDILFGRSEAMGQVKVQIEKLAAANVPVLITGESGTGKEIIARLIHARSPWNSGPFVKVNCPAIPQALLESELFGYEKGGFTGASASKPGRVEMARRGTLFLDEIAELDAALQAKLLQVLQDGQFCRIGATEDRAVEARVICATNRDLITEIEAGNFRQDLFFRINVLTVHLAPLRERAEDVPELAEYFRQLYNERYNCQAKPVSAQVLRRLAFEPWPGNMRQLENLMKRYVILGTEDAITSELTAPEPASALNLPTDGATSLKKVTRQAVREVERQVILRSLEANNWNRRRVARELSISYRALLYKIRDAGISSQRMGRWPGMNRSHDDQA